ncbi:hypothetical protein [Arthrobacter glacialis]|uniref:hypothetical protein n=1 Tax=Arthrobacter glacialis TaxID=1664 RepID=UPI0010574D55|nr:hypothetical protein [Arthrobacter glacialis]
MESMVAQTAASAQNLPTSSAARPVAQTVPAAQAMHVTQDEEYPLHPVALSPVAFNKTFLSRSI